MVHPELMSISIYNPKGGGGGATFATTPMLHTDFPFSSVYLGTFDNGGANVITIAPLVIPYGQKVTNIIFVGGMTSGSGTVDVALYDTTGARICSNGGTSTGTTTSGIRTFAMSAATNVNAGQYLFAVSASTGNLRVQANGSASNILQYYTTSTTASSGVLPSSLSLSASGANAAVFVPIIIFT